MTLANKRVFAAAAAVAAAAGLSGCDKPADVASENLSTAADNFQIERQINFIDTITGQNIVTIRGLCSLGNNDKPGELSVTCKVGEGQYVKDFFGLSNSVAYSSVQIGAAGVNTAHYSIEFNPSVLVPYFRTAGGPPLTTSSTEVMRMPQVPGTAVAQPAQKRAVIPAITQ